MRMTWMLCGAALAISASASVIPAAGAAQKPYTIGVITALTGPAAAIGVPLSQGLKVAHAHWPEINGREVRIIEMDSTTDPTVAARDARKLIEEDHVDVLIGAPIAPSAMAISPIASAHKTPFLDVSQVGPYNAANAWTTNITPSADVFIGKIAERMKRNGVHTIGYLGFSDAWGDVVYKHLLSSVKQLGGMRVVGTERYARSDTSVTGQVLRILAKHPDAVMTGTDGAPGALPYRELARLGYRGQIYGTPAIMNLGFTKTVGSAGNGLVDDAGPLQVAEELPASNPSKAISLQYMKLYEQTFHVPLASAYSGYTFDAYLVLKHALEKVGPDVQPGTVAFRTALKDAIQRTRGVDGTQGSYAFRPGHMYGVLPDSILIVKLKDGQWHWDP